MLEKNMTILLDESSYDDPRSSGRPFIQIRDEFFICRMECMDRLILYKYWSDGFEFIGFGQS